MAARESPQADALTSLIHASKPSAEESSLVNQLRAQVCYLPTSTVHARCAILQCIMFNVLFVVFMSSVNRVDKVRRSVLFIMHRFPTWSTH
jgi:hypothetical protein